MPPGPGAEVETRGGAGDDAAAAVDAGDAGAPACAPIAAGVCRRCSPPGSRRWSSSTAASAAPVTSRRSRTSRSRSMGRAQVRVPRRWTAAARPTRCAGTALAPVELAEKEGLALINGTDGMLGQLILAMRRPRRAAPARGRRGGDERRGAARHRPRVRRRPAGAAAAPGSGGRARRTCARCSPAPPIVASHAGPEDTRVQDAYSLRCAPQVAGAARDTVAHARRSRRANSQRPIDNPVVTLDGRVESNGNFHGAPVGVRPRLPRHRRRRSRRDRASAAPTGSSTCPQPRPAAVPRRRSRRRQRLHDRAVHPGCDGLRTQAAGRPGERRLDPVLGDAGGPRLDGMVGRAQAAPGGRRLAPCSRHRGAHRGARRSICARRCDRRRRPRR